MADQVSILLAETQVNAGSAVTATVNFRTRATASASVPTSIRYRVDCLSTGRNIIDWTAVTAASAVSITVPGTDGEIINAGNDTEKRQLTVESDTGLSTQYRSIARWFVRNLGIRVVPAQAVSDDVVAEALLMLPYTGAIALVGNKFSNGAATGMLVGANMSGMENSTVAGFADWSFDGGAPDWTEYATWNPNVVRIPLNAASFLNLTCGKTSSQAITFTATPASASTGGTLTGNWPLASGNYPIAFNGNDDPATLGAFTSGNTAVTWAALSQASPGASAVAMYWHADTHDADPFGTYRASINTAILAARAIGCYVVFDLHWCRPNLTIGGVTKPLWAINQSSFADADTAIPFWEALVAWLISTYGASGYSDIIFDLFNEPFLNFGPGVWRTTEGGATPVTADDALLVGGWGSQLVNETQSGANWRLAHPWRLAGYQEMLDAIRAAGATNICIVKGNTYSQEVGTGAFKPTDALNQVAIGWHPYPHGTYPYSDDDVGPRIVGSEAQVLAIIAGGTCVIGCEDGGRGGTAATDGEAHMQYMNEWSEANGVSRIIWQWNSTRSFGTASTDNFLTAFAADGTTVLPIQGAGQVVYDWMVSL